MKYSIEDVKQDFERYRPSGLADSGGLFDLDLKQEQIAKS